MTIRKEYHSEVSYRINVSFDNGCISALVFSLDEVYNYLKTSPDFIACEIVRIAL